MKILFFFILWPPDPLSLWEAGKVVYKGQPGHTPESPLGCDISRWQCWLLVSKSEFALGAWVSTILNWLYSLRRFLNCSECTFWISFCKFLVIWEGLTVIIFSDIILSLNCYINRIWSFQCTLIFPIFLFCFSCSKFNHPPFVWSNQERNRCVSLEKFKWEASAHLHFPVFSVFLIFQNIWAFYSVYNWLVLTKTAFRS